jgi:type I restriction enzyme S subunit
MGQSPPGSSYSELGNGMPLLNGAADIKTDGFAPKKCTTAPTRTCRQGDAVLCIRATIGRTTPADGEYCLGRGVAALRPNSTIDLSYLIRVVENNLQQLDRFLSGSTIKGIRREHLEQIEFNLPSLAEQKRIAAILDKADEIKQVSEISGRKREEFLFALFYEMFETPLLRYIGKNQQNKFPEWRMTTIGEQITLQRGFDITKKQATKGEIPVISSGGFSYFHKEKKAQGPGVVLGRKGSVGSVHYVDQDYWPHDTTLWVKEFNDNIPYFVYFFFKNFPLNRYEASSANPSLDRNNLHPIKLMWPSKRLQEKFCSVALGVNSLEKHNHEQLNNLLNSISQEILS